jgi:hypothetical protein
LLDFTKKKLIYRGLLEYVVNARGFFNERCNPQGKFIHCGKRGSLEKKSPTRMRGQFVSNESTRLICGF